MFASVFASLRVRVIGLILLAVVPVMAAAIYLAAYEQQSARADAQSDALREARLIADRQAERLQDANELLLLLAQLPQVNSGDPSVCHLLLAQVLRQRPEYINLTVSKPNGDVLCSAVPMAAAINVEDGQVFQHAVQGRRFTIGGYQIDRVTGQPSVHVALPAGDAEGEVASVVMGSLSLEGLCESLRPDTGNPEKVVTLVDRNGAIVARYPNAPDSHGRPLEEAGLWTQVRNRLAGTTELVGADHVRRLYAFASVGNGPEPGLGVTISTPARVVYADSTTPTMSELLIYGATALFAVGVAWLGIDRAVLAPTDVLARAARRWHSGDLSARAGLVRQHGELAQVAHAFNGMAQSLERKEAERTCAENALTQEVKANSTVAELLGALVTSMSLDDFSNRVLTLARRATDSPFGCVAYIDPETGHLVSPALTREIGEQCRVEDKDLVFEHVGGLWDWVRENRQPLLTNAPADDPRSTITPASHLPIRRFLSVPTMLGDTLVGQIAVANAARDYGEPDRVLLERVAGIYAIAIQRQRAEQVLWKSNELLERLFSVIDLKIAYMDRDYNFIRVNRAYAEADGHEPDYFIGKNHFALYPNAENQALFRRVVETGKPYTAFAKPFAYPEHPERGMTYWDWNLQPSRDADGQISGLVLSLLDVTARHRAVEALQLERDNLKNILDTLPDGVFIVNSELDLEYVNPAIRKEFGAVQAKCYEYFHGRTEQCPWCKNERVFAGQCVQWELTMKTGKTFELLDAPLKKEDGRIVNLCLFHDITTRKRVEDFIRMRLELMEFAAAHSLPQVLQKAVDLAGELTGSPIGFFHFVENDRRAVRLGAWSSRTLQEFCKAGREGLHYPIDQAGVWVDCVHARKPVIHNDYASLPHRKGMPEGHVQVVRELVVPIVRGENVVAIMGVGNKTTDYTERDSELVAYFADLAWEIAERTRAEEQVRKMSRAVRQSPVSIFITDAHGDIEYVNPGFTQATGYTFEEVLGKNPRFLKSGELPAEAYRALWETITAGKEWRGEFHNKRKDGSLIWQSASISPVTNADGVITHYLGIEEDITEHKEHEREMVALLALGAALRAAPTRAEMLPVLLDQVADLFKADAAALAIVDANTGEVVIELGRGVFVQSTGLRIPPGKGISGLVIATGQPYCTDDVESDAQFYQRGIFARQRYAMAGIPLAADDQTIGVLWVARRQPVHADEMRLLNALANMAANAIHRAILYEQTEHRLRQVQALHNIDIAIASSIDQRVPLGIVLAQATSQLQVDAADILLLTPHAHTLEPVAHYGFRSPGIERSRLILGEGYAGRAALERTMVCIPNLNAAGRSFARASLFASEGFVAYYGVPLIAKGRVLGVLEIFHRAPLQPKRDWLAFLDALAGQAAIAIDNAEMFEKLERSYADMTVAYDATIEGWSRALDLRDHETEGHTQRVTEMTLRLAHQMGVPAANLVHVYRGALLHDIGKMGIPDDILHKPGALTPAEWEVMRQHPIYARNLLSPIAFLEPALEIPYCHHEKWDGTGYPRGLRGEQIPVAARIFSVVDVWDALTSDRPYRSAWSAAQALEHLRKGAGQCFQPQVVEHFVKMIDEQSV